MDLLENPTLKKLAVFVDKIISKKTPELTPEERPENDKQKLFNNLKTTLIKKYYRVSYFQERVWFLNKLVADSPLFNVGMFNRFRNEIDIASLRNAIQAIIDRHEILRTNFFYNEKPRV